MISFQPPFESIMPDYVTVGRCQQF